MPDYCFTVTYNGTDSEESAPLDILGLNYQLIDNQTNGFLANHDYALADGGRVVASGLSDENGYINLQNLERGEFTVMVGVGNIQSGGRPSETEIYQLPILANILAEHRLYRIEWLVPRILAHYFESEAPEIRQRLHRICHRPSIFQYLITTLAELNGIEGGINGQISRATTSITIPTFTAFYRAVFPAINTIENPSGQIRVDPQNGVLNRLNFMDALERIVQNPGDRGVAFTNLNDNEAQRRIEEILEAFRIYTVSTEANGQAPQHRSAIRIFQNEFIGRNRNNNDINLSGELNPETLLAMNRAVEEDWQRIAPYEMVTILANGNDTRRYYPRLRTRPVIPQFTQQGAWGAISIPGLFNALGEERTVANAGCAIAFVANMVHTHRERLIAGGRLPEESRNTIINPGTIAQTPAYFDQGRIFWSRPVRTLLRPLVNDTPFPDFFPNIGNMTELPIQYYIAIRIFVSGNFGTRPADGFTGEHWVGVKELVTFPVRTRVTTSAPVNGVAPTVLLTAPVQYYRISPTSEHDLIPGVAVVANTHNNRGVRRWQFRQNGNNPLEIYIPLSEVIEYRIFRIPRYQ
jgi:hypothetical protein